MSVTINVLGGLNIRNDGYPLVFPTRHAMLMLAFLAVEHPQPQTRNRLIGIFWADRNEQQARGSLRQTLYRLRKVLDPVDPDAIEASAQTIGLKSGLFQTDLELLEKGELASSGGAAGEFLKGWEGITSELDEWIALHRNRTRDRMHQVLRDQLAGAEQHMDYAAMTATAKQIMAIDRYDEEAVQHLMAGLALAGNPAAAREAFSNFRELLEQELGTAPMLETQALADNIERQQGRFAPRVQAGQTGNRLAAPFALPETGREKRHVAVLVAWMCHDDLNDPDPERVAEGIDQIRGPVRDIVERYGGALGAEAGLLNICWFGWPVALEDAAGRAMRAALELCMAVPCRIGISSGDVLSSVSSEPVGKAPNEAVQLMTAAVTGQIRVANAIGEASEARFEFIDPPEGGPGMALQGERIAGRPTEINAYETTEIFGRGHELDLLIARAETARSGESQLALISGEAGIGKSRLAQAGARIAREMGARYLLLQCSRYQQDIAFGPVIEHLRLVSGLQISANFSLQRRTLDAHLERAGVALPEERAAIAELLGLPAADDAGGPPARERMRSVLLGALASYYTNAGTAEFVYLVIEDMHWCDPSTIEMINTILSNHAGSRIILVLTARPGFDADQFAAQNLTGLSLSGLSRSEMASLVRRTAEEMPISDEQVERIVERADGIPLYAEELTRSALRRGAEATATDETPPLLREAMMARLDSLGDSKAVALRAACVGRRFTMGPLRAACGDMADRIDGALVRMLDEKLIFRHSQASGEGYIFRHAMLRDAAYDSLPQAERILIHLRLYEHYRDRPDALPQLVAWHAAAGRRHMAALKLYKHTGDEALRQFAHREARADYEKALEQIAHVPFTNEAEDMRLEILSQLSLCHAHADGYGHQDTLDVLSEAQRLALSRPDSKHTIPILWQTFSVRFTHADAEEARQVGEQLLALKHWNLEYGPQKVAGFRFIAAGDMLLGRFREAEQRFAAAAEILENEDAPSTIPSIGVDQRIPVMLMRARALACLGQGAKAYELIETARVRSNPAAHTPSNILFNILAAHTLLAMRDFSGAGRHAAIGLELSQREGTAMWGAYSACIDAVVRTQAGFDDAVWQSYREAREMLMASRTRVSTTLMDARMADALCRADRADLAQPIFERVAEAVSRDLEPWCHAEVLRIRAESGYRTGRHSRETAVEYCERSLAIAQKQEAGLWISNVTETLEELRKE